MRRFDRREGVKVTMIPNLSVGILQNFARSWPEIVGAWRRYGATEGIDSAWGVDHFIVVGRYAAGTGMTEFILERPTPSRWAGAERMLRGGPP